MNRNILKILICSLAILLAMGAVSAMDSNSTDDLKSIESDSQDLIADDGEDILAVESNEEDVVADDASEIIASQDDEILAAEDDSEDVLAFESDEDVISKSSDDGVVLTSSIKQDDKLSMSESKSVLGLEDSQIEYKTFTLGKLKIPKKYKKFYNGYEPSKSNKKALKKYKKYQKVAKKQLKKFKKSTKKVMKSIAKGNWYADEGDMTYKTKTVGKNIITTFYLFAYRYV